MSLKKKYTFVNTNDEGDESGIDDDVTWYDDRLIHDPSGESDVFFIEPTDSERFTAIEPYCLESPISVTFFNLSGDVCSELNIALMPLRVLDNEDVDELLELGGFLVVGGGGGSTGFLLTIGPKDLLSVWFWKTLRKEAVVPLRGLLADLSDFVANCINKKNHVLV